MDKTTSQQMLAHAEKLCAQRGVRLTPQRLEVLRLMSLQQGAISAYDLLDLLREKEPQAKPPTVYRALEFLLEQGFVHKVESTNSYVLCHLFDQPTHSSAMFICDPLRRRERRVRGRRRRYNAYAGGKNGIRAAPQRH
ncbi:zinc uptake transcriptional repressor [Klebsiella oxytoca]|nr:zinc uptake transcriptional repressor [Klebsiella oxytoca]